MKGDFEFFENLETVLPDYEAQRAKLTAEVWEELDSDVINGWLSRADAERIYGEWCQRYNP